MKVRILESTKNHGGREYWIVQVKNNWLSGWTPVNGFTGPDAYQNAKAFALKLAAPKIENIKKRG